MRFVINNRSEIGDVLSLRYLVKQLQKEHPDVQVVVREDRHGLLADLEVQLAPVFCPLCGCADFDTFLEMPYCECLECGLYYQHPVPPLRYEGSHEPPGDQMSNHDKAVNTQLAASLYAQTKPASVLDVGSKYPWLLKCFKELGAAVLGIDGCSKAAEYGEKLGVSTIQSNFLTWDFKGAKFDLVTLVHLIEHMPNPRLLIRKIKRLLNDAGYLFVRTPDTLGDVSEGMCASYYAIHPLLFNKINLIKLLIEEGFQLICTGNPINGQVDVLARLIDRSKERNPILSQWVNDIGNGDWLRRKYHFYAFPQELALRLGWIDSYQASEFIDLPPLPECNNVKEAPVVIAHESGFNAAGTSRAWPKERWVRVAQWLLKHDIPVVTVGVKPLGVEGVVELAGEPLLKQLAFLKHAKLVIAADTSIPHVAAALGAPTVVLSGPADPTLTYPASVHVVERFDLGCTRCHNKIALEYQDGYFNGMELPLHHCGKLRNVPCMDAISVTQVIDKLAEVLKIPVAEGPLLSVVICARNEEKAIARCIKSVALADEIVLLDTGCTDRTVELAKAADPRVNVCYYDVGDPIRSFSEMRNVANSFATGEYVMWLDAGDEATKLDLIKEKLLTCRPDHIGLQTIYGHQTYWRDRVVARGFAYWTDAVHEVLDTTGLYGISILAAPVKHTWQTKVGRENSLPRNIRLLRQMIEKESPQHPRYSRWIFYLARDLKDAGQLEEAAELFKARMLLEGFHEEAAQAALMLADILQNTGKMTESIKICYEGMKTHDGYREFYYLIGDAYFKLGDYEKALVWYMHSAVVPRDQRSLWHNEAVFDWLPNCQISYCTERLGDFTTALEYAQKDLALCPPVQRARAEKRVNDLKIKLDLV